MTVYGGKKTDWGIRINGFFVTCTRCGWHGKVKVDLWYANWEEPYVRFSCEQCKNCWVVKDEI